MKKILVLINLLFLFSGCYNYKELNNYAIVTGMAIDKENKNYQVSILVSNPEKNNTSEKFTIYTEKEKTIEKAMEQIELMLPKEIYIGHLSILIISDKVAQDGINDTLNFFLQEKESSNNFFIALSKNVDAKDILLSKSNIIDFPSQYLSNNIKNQSKSTPVTFNSLIYKLTNKGTNPIITSFELKNNQAKISDMGIFKYEKLAGWTNEKENIGIKIINNEMKNFVFDNKLNNITINNIKCKKAIKGNNVFLYIKANGVVKNNNKVKNEIIEEEIKKYIKAAIKKSKKIESDIFDIGLIYYQNKTKEFYKIKNWNKHFKKLKFHINVKVSIDKNNLENKRIERIKDEKNE